MFASFDFNVKIISFIVWCEALLELIIDVDEQRKIKLKGIFRMKFSNIYMFRGHLVPIHHGDLIREIQLYSRNNQMDLNPMIKVGTQYDQKQKRDQVSPIAITNQLIYCWKCPFAIHRVISSLYNTSFEPCVRWFHDIIINLDI